MDQNTLWTILNFLFLKYWTSFVFSQQICEEWSKKPDGEKEFEPFYRAVSAVANSTGTRLKTRVQMLNQVKNSCSMTRKTVLMKKKKCFIIWSFLESQLFFFNNHLFCHLVKCCMNPKPCSLWLMLLSEF